MRKRDFNRFQINEIKNMELSYNKAKDFFQCKHCINEFMNNSLHEHMTPREYGMYEASFYPFIYPGGKKAQIVVVWCKRCGRVVWDSRWFSPIR